MGCLEQFEALWVELKGFEAGCGVAFEELEHVEGGAEHGGVGEGAELTDRAGKLFGFGIEAFEQCFRENGEVAFLTNEAGGGQAEGASGVGEAGGVGVGSEVL